MLSIKIEKISILLRRFRLALILTSIIYLNLSVIYIFIYVLIKSSLINIIDYNRIFTFITNILSEFLIKKSELYIMRHILKNLFLEDAKLLSTIIFLFDFNITPSI